MFHERCSLIQFLKIYGLCNQGKEVDGHCNLNQCGIPLQRPSQEAEARGPSAMQTYTSWMGSGGLLFTRMQGALPCKNHLISSYFISASSPTNLFLTPLTLQNLHQEKSTGKHIPKQPAEKNGIIKIKVVSWLRDSFSHLNSFSYSSLGGDSKVNVDISFSSVPFRLSPPPHCRNQKLLK